MTAPDTAKNQGAFVKQASIIALSMLIGRVLGFIYRLPLTGLLGDEGNAWYSMGYSVYTVVLLVTAGALIPAVSKLVSERMALGQMRNAHCMFHTALKVSTIMGFAAALMLWFGARFISNIMLNSPQAFYAIRALAPAMVLLGPLGAFRGYFMGMKTAFPMAVSQVSEQIFNVGFSLFLAFLFFDAERLHRSVAGAAAGTGIGVLVGLVVLIFLYSLVQRDYQRQMVKDLSRPLETERQQAKILFAMAAPITLSMVMLALTSPLDFSMANARLAYSGVFNEFEISELVGQFGGKFILLTGLPVAMAGALSHAVTPEISASHSLQDKQAVCGSVNTALRLAMLISIPAAVGLAVMADPILALLFPSFPDGGFMLMWGAACVVFMAINQILTATLFGVGKPYMPVVAAGVGLLVKIPINHYLMAVPEINILGAVISTIVCFIVAALLNLFFLYRATGLMPRFGEAMGKPLVATTLMGVTCFVLHAVLAMIMPGRAATVFTLILGVLVYVTVLMIVRGVREEDAALLPIPKSLKRRII
ncbi:MAG: polysaccharide biosynthesis protein [Defluviitaleaceae bacterium]|nr:polysaccharide biosynthesis protein [Defluviitaleaceae bacterium]